MVDWHKVSWGMIAQANWGGASQRPFKELTWFCSPKPLVRPLLCGTTQLNQWLWVPSHVACSLHVSSGAFLRMCGLNFARCESVQPSNAMACSNLRMQRGRPTKSSRAKRFRCFDRVQLFLLRSDSHSVEVDGMTPWKTTFLYKQEVISTSM